MNYFFDKGKLKEKVRQVRFTIPAVLLILAISCVPALAGANKTSTSGTYEIMADAVTSGGSASQNAAGSYILYHSVGQAMGLDVLAINNYELVGGFLGVVDETGPTVSFSNPVVASTVSGSVEFVGTAFDENGSTWTLYYGPGTAPSTETQLSTGAANTSAASLGTWDSTTTAGTYTARIVAVDDRGNSSYTTVTFTVQNLATITGTAELHKWILVSTPVTPSAPSTPDSMYDSTYNYRVYKWNPTAGASGNYEVPASFTAGDGYWLKVYNPGDMNYSYTGTIADMTQEYVISISTGWNQLGTPFNRDFPWGQMTVRYGGTDYDLATAAGMGLLSDILWSYNSNANSYEQRDTTQLMGTQEGMYLRAYDNVDLVFDPDDAIVPGAPLAAAKIIRTNPFGFRMKISAYAPQSSDTDNYLGISKDASLRFDRLDIEDPGVPPGGNYTNLYFPHDDWTRNPARYANDTRPAPDTTGETENWDFNVETNENAQTITLTWDNSNLPADNYSFTLINLSNGDTIDMIAQTSYTYTSPADGSAVNFRIEVKTVKEMALSSKSYTLSEGWNLISVPIEPEITSAIAQLGDDLPFLNVFQFYDGELYAAEEADIQAGIGYWIHVDKNTEIDIEGLPVASEIHVPLKPGWNAIGNPFDVPLTWGDNISVGYGGNTYTLSQAIAAGLMPDKIFLYNNDEYESVEHGGSMESWRGYFIKVPHACTIVLEQ